MQFRGNVDFLEIIDVLSARIYRVFTVVYLVNCIFTWYNIGA
jgi:hypothetical protein